MGEDGNLYRPEDPMEESIKNNDYIVVEGPPNRETAERAMQISKKISKQISAARTKEDVTNKGIKAAEERLTSDTVSFDQGGLMSDEVGQSLAKTPLDFDPERLANMQAKMRDVVPSGAYELYMKGDTDIQEEYAELREEDAEAFDTVMRINTDVNRQGMDRAQFSTEDAVKDSPIPEIDTYLMENSVYLNTIPPGFESSPQIADDATAQVIPESPIVERTRRGQLPGFATYGAEEQDQVRIHETAHASGLMGDYDSIMTKVFGDVETAEAATTGLDLYRAISRDDPLAARRSMNYLISQGVNLYLDRDDLVDNMMRAIDVLEQTSDGGIELTPERKVEIRSDIEKEFKNVPRILENMRLERAGEKKLPEMDKGGLMAADGVDVSKSAEDLLDEFNVFEGSTAIIYDDEARERDAKVYDDPVAQKMNRQLDTAFRKLFNKQDTVTREDYSKTVQVIRNQNPEVFDKYFFGPNTDAKIEALNYEEFSDNPLPHMDEEAEAVSYTLNIPFGSENELTLGGPTGLRGWARPKNRYDDEEIFVAGKGGEDAPKRSATARHEVRHLKHGDYEGRSGTWEENRMRDLDALDAVLSQDPVKIQDIFDLEYGSKLKKNPESFPTYVRWFANTLRERLQNAVNLLPELYRDGVFDKSKADKELVKQFLEDYDKDEQGFVDSLLGNDPEKQTDVDIKTSTTDAKKLAKILSVAPFVEEADRGGSSWPYRVDYKINREATGMNAGGLMADPLVLSETAEEEAEPKMGVGEYIQAGMDLVEDFSPAGTAQAMIDAAEEAYKLASGAEDASLLNLGVAAIGAIPGGKTATKVVDNASKIADEIAEASLEISKLDNYVPKKTVKAYKLFTKGEDDNLYPLFVDANKPLPVGEWIKANMPDYIFQAKNGRYYVPSKATAPKTETGKKAFYDTGERKATGSSVEIPDDPELRKKLVEAGFIAKEGTKSVKAVAARPGWHSGDVPIAHHIGAMIDPATGGTKKLEMPNVRRDDQVWAEVELPADVDWQQEALRRANVKKDGQIDVGTAHITDRVPHGGSYRYKTNPNMTGEWLIAGELKINRVLDDAEVKAINEAAGVEDLPRYSDFMKQYTETPTQTGIMSAEGAAKKSPAVDMAINVRVDKKADLDYAEKLISGEKVYETRNSRSLDPYIGQRVGIAKTGDGKAQAIGSVEIGEPIEVDEKTFRELQDKHLVPEGSAFDVPKGGKKYLYPVSNPERFESPKDVGRGIVSRKIVNKYAGGLMSDEYNRAES
jgi:hypothetical protein